MCSSDLDPICNITDEADRAVPVFGPIFAGGLRAVLPFIRRFEVTDLLPGAGKLSAVNYPADCTWRVQEYPADFANRREEIAAAGDDRLMFYRFRFRVAEPMKLGLLLGYDGPVKAWIDGRQVFHDPKGTNPAIPDAKRVRFTASGEHEVVVALGSNAGNAWGIFARLERFDVTPSQLAAGGYAMPVVV